MSDWRNVKSGKGLRLAVLGDPIDHSLSPVMHAAALNDMSIEGEYLGLRVPADEFQQLLDLPGELPGRCDHFGQRRATDL